MPDVDVRVHKEGVAYIADVTVKQRALTMHRVRVSLPELDRYAGSTSADVADLVRRSFDFLLEREPNTSILREFSLSTIERYFPEYPDAIRSGERRL